MHRQFGGDGGREGKVAGERPLPEEDEGSKEQGPDAEDVNPFVDGVIVVGSVEGELYMVGGWV